MAANPISPSDATAYLHQVGRHLSPDEIALVYEIDDLWLSIFLASDDEVDTSTPPMTDAGDLDRKAVASKIKAAFGMLSRKE